MAYNSLIPQPTDNLSTSQPQLLANFGAIATAFNLNHTSFNSASPAAGTHMFVEMPNQNASPPTTIANEVELYCNTSTYTTKPELFFIKQNGNADLPLGLRLANGFEISASNYIQNGGWTRLPSGILLKWGTFSTSLNTGVVTFPVDASIPIFNNIFTIYATANNSTTVGAQYYNIGDAVNPILTTSFGVTCNTTNINLAYLAIGY